MAAPGGFGDVTPLVNITAPTPFLAGNCTLGAGSSITGPAAIHKVDALAATTFPPILGSALGVEAADGGRAYARAPALSLVPTQAALEEAAPGAGAPIVARFPPLPSSTPRTFSPTHTSLPHGSTTLNRGTWGSGCFTGHPGECGQSR